MALRLMAALAVIVLASSAAHAGVAEELTSAINKCAAISDAATRHACYDQLPALVKSLATKPVAAQPEADTSPDGPDLFAAEPVAADHITAAIESYTFKNGLFVVTLDNGQVWSQVTSSNDLLRLGTGKTVTIWRSRFGYEVLKIKGTRTKYHVRRIR